MKALEKVLIVGVIAESLLAAYAMKAEKNSASSVLDSFDETVNSNAWNLHKGSEVCIDDFEANRAPDHRYRTATLEGLWTHPKRGFFHDGRFPTLLDVVNHYDSCFSLGLSNREKSDLVEYLKSLPGDEGN